MVRYSVEPWLVVVVLQAGNTCKSSSITHTKNGEEILPGTYQRKFWNEPVIIRATILR
jgi:hypothetical protein